MKTTIVTFPKVGDLIYEEEVITVVLLADKKQMRITELYPSGMIDTVWYGNNYRFTILCPSEK